MFGLRNKGRLTAEKVHQSIGGAFDGILGYLRKKTRYDGRARIANSWAKKHPRKVMFIYGFIAIALISVNIAEFFIADSPKSIEKPEKNYSMLNISSHNEIMENNMLIREQLNQINEKKIKLIEQYDSLQNLSQKSHEDSIRMYSLYYSIINKKQERHESKTN